MNDNAQTQPASRPLALDYFYVAIDKQEGNSRIFGIPVSPCFRTLEEAGTFHETAVIEGSYCINATYFPRSTEDARQREELLFSGETQPAMTSQTCHKVGKSAVARA